MNDDCPEAALPVQPKAVAAPPDVASPPAGDSPIDRPGRDAGGEPRSVAPAGSDGAVPDEPAGAAPATTAMPDDEADPFGVASDDSRYDDAMSARAERAARGHFGIAGDWQDDLIEAVPMPGTVPGDERAAFEAQLAVLPVRRLLLIRHAPTAAAEARATGILRAVVSELLQREPQRCAISSKFDRPFAPQSLSHTPQWRPERRRSVIYLFRSDDPDSLAFFSRQIEPVRHLWRTLIENDSYLVLTVAMPDATPLREEALLRDEIAVWQLRDTQVEVPLEAPVTVADCFDAIVTAVAALFPGLGFREYAELVERLAPPLRVWPRDDGSARSRHERWYAGERDAVRAELHVVLRAPHMLEDVATDDAGAEPGMYLDTPERRVGMPEWLYERQLSVLDEIAGAVADVYFSASASPRLCVGYRRLVLRLDALGVRRLESQWVLASLESSLGTQDLYRRLVRAGELLTEAGNGSSLRGSGAIRIDEFARLLQVGESRLIDALRVAGALKTLAENGSAPYAAVFWAKVRALAGCESAYFSARYDAFDVILYLLAQHQRSSAETIGALVDAVERSNGTHLTWASAAGLASRRKRPPVSAARMAMRDALKTLLRNGSERWLEHAETVIRLCRSARPPGARWLARDFVDALARQCDALVDAAAPALYAALLGGASRDRFVAVLAGLFEVTAPGGGAADGNEVGMRIVVSVYRALVLSLLRHESAATVPLVDRAAALSRPWLRTLQPALRREVMPAAQQQLVTLQNERRRQRGNAAALRRADEAVIALQSLMRCWQESARGAGRERSVST